MPALSVDADAYAGSGVRFGWCAFDGEAVWLISCAGCGEAAGGDFDVGVSGAQADAAGSDAAARDEDAEVSSTGVGVSAVVPCTGLGVSAVVASRDGAGDAPASVGVIKLGTEKDETEEVSDGAFMLDDCAPSMRVGFSAAPDWYAGACAAPCICVPDRLLLLLLLLPLSSVVLVALPL